MASKFKKGDVVRVIGDSPSYPYCIGKTGVVVDFSIGVDYDVPIVEFDFDLPDAPVNNVDRRSRKFINGELELDKETKVLTILRQWRDSR